MFTCFATVSNKFKIYIIYVEKLQEPLKRSIKYKGQSNSYSINFQNAICLECLRIICCLVFLYVEKYREVYAICGSEVFNTIVICPCKLT